MNPEYLIFPILFFIEDFSSKIKVFSYEAEIVTPWLSGTMMTAAPKQGTPAVDQ